MNKYYIKFILGLFLGIFLSCGQENPTNQNHNGFKHCAAGTPNAIFSSELDLIKKHDFQLKARSGVESIVFKDDLALQIFQTGCEQITQEFNFTLSGDFSDKKQVEWVDECIRLFRYMSTASPKHAIFNMWAGEIDRNKLHIKLGEKYQLAEGFFIKLNKIASSDQAFLAVTVSQ